VEPRLVALSGHPLLRLRMDMADTVRMRIDMGIDMTAKATAAVRDESVMIWSVQNNTRRLERPGRRVQVRPVVSGSSRSRAPRRHSCPFPWASASTSWRCGWSASNWSIAD